MADKVIVGLSGGVDSSFAAARLKEQGYDVIGIMLRLWAEPSQEENNKCCSPDAVIMARRVAALLDIPFYVIDARDEFYKHVVTNFIEGYTAGITPNPCIACNIHIRWSMLLDQADKFDAQYVATGHYGQIEHTSADPILSRGVDDSKDQSYVLSMLPKSYLKRTLLPAGGFFKKDIREKCKLLGLPTASRPDSQDLCFLGNMDYREFLRKYAPESNQPGEIEDMQGRVIGHHTGLADYTLGQRKGLHIANPVPLYVVGKDSDKNTIRVGDKKSVERDHLMADQVNWLVDIPENIGQQLKVKVRYSAMPQTGVVTRTGNQFSVVFNKGIRDITPGQIAVLYAENICVGGGYIV